MDLHPTDNTTSDIKTSPPVVTTPAYRRRPASFSPIGRSIPIRSEGDSLFTASRPNVYQLAAMDSARRKEPIIADGINKISLALTLKVGNYYHPDENIQRFVRANIEPNLKRWISVMTQTVLWSGFGVNEILWKKKLGPGDTPQVWVEDLINYHPSQVQMRLNNNYRLTHGEKLYNSTYLTGIWVPTPITDKVRAVGPSNTGSYIRLPKSNLYYLAFNSDGNNPWGNSMLTSVLEYHIFKEAFREMLSIALDRYGTPLVYAIVPHQQTSEVMIDMDGSSRPKWLYEQVKDAMQDLRGDSALVFTQVDKDNPISIDSLTTGNNFADAFTSAIDMCDQNMMIGMGIPDLILKNKSTGLGSSGAAERQTELFHAYVSSLYELVVNGFLDQVVRQLIQYNFDPRTNTKAYELGYIKQKPLRYSELTTLTGMVDTLTKHGYLSPESLEDGQQVRELFDIAGEFKYVRPTNRTQQSTSTGGTSTI